MTDIMRQRGLWIASAFMIIFASVAAPLAGVHAQEDVTVDPDAEETEYFHEVLQLRELSNTEAPTTIVGQASDGTNWVIEIDEDTRMGTWFGNTNPLDRYITGDQIDVRGTRSLHTDIVEADLILNLSLNIWRDGFIQGWIDSIDYDANTVEVQWNNELTTVSLTDNTHIVVPPTNPATIDDLAVNQRVRVRTILDSDVENEARIFITLRDEFGEILLKARTRAVRGEILEIDDNGDGTGSLAVQLTHNPHLKADDLNNLYGVEGDTRVVYFDENTKIVRRYFGWATIDEFMEGDEIVFIGRVDDDETIDARLLKNNSIWRRGTGTFRNLGEVLSVDADAGTFTATLVRKDDGRTWTIVSDAETVIRSNGEESSIADLEVGDVVRVLGTVHETNLTIDADVISTRDALDILEHFFDTHPHAAPGDTV